MATYNFINPAESLQTPKPMSLGEMLNIGTGMQQFQSQGIELRRQQQLEKERNIQSQFMQNHENFMQDLGNGQKQVDLNKVNQFALQNMPLSGNDFVQQMSATAQNTAAANQAQLSMGKDARSEGANLFMTLSNAGVQNKQAYLDALRARGRELNNPWIQQYADSIEKNLASVPESGTHIPQMFAQAAQSAMSVQDQAPQANTINTAAGTFQTTTTMINGKPVMTMGNMIAPAQPELMEQPDPATGQPLYRVYNYQKNAPEITAYPDAPEYKPQAGQYGYGQPATQPAQPSTAVTQLTDQFNQVTPTSHAYTGVSPARQTAIAQGTKLIESDRNIAPTLPQQTDLANKIINEAIKTPTGGGSGLLAALSGNVFATQTLGIGDSATDLQTLGHNLAAYTNSIAQNAGLGTDAGRALAGEMSGTTNWTPEAIIRTARTNRALTHATRLLVNGRQNAVDKSGDAASASDFSLKWGKTAKLDAIRLMDAYENRAQDPAGFDAIVKEFGGNKSARFKQALKDSTAIEQLVGQ